MSSAAARAPKPAEAAPATGPRARGVLIVDPDPAFHGAIRGDPRANQVAPVLAKTGREAQLILADTTKLLTAVVINPSTKDPNGISVIRASHLHRPATPIYVIHDEDLGLDEKDLKRLGVQRTIKKPQSYAQILDIVAPALLFDPGAALELAKANVDRLNSELTAGDVEFVGIRAEDFLSGSKTFFDVYVRLSSGRYVKILQSGDVFSPERVVQYLKKGVTYFYLRKEVQQQYLNFCDKMATAVLKSDRVDIGTKISQTFNHGQETLNFLRNQGISEANLQYATNFVNNVQLLVQQMEPQKHQVLNDFLNDLAAYEHGVGTAAVSSLLMNQLAITGDSPVQILGLAALLHDIGLYSMPPNVRSEDETAMTEEERRTYQTHPMKGAEMLKKIPRIHPTVVQAVAQHHERRTRKGFPGQIGVGAMNRIAEIVGISDEFVKLVEQSKTNPKIDVRRQMEKEVFLGFSFQVVEAFRIVFFTPEGV